MSDDAQGIKLIDWDAQDVKTRIRGTRQLSKPIANVLTVRNVNGASIKMTTRAGPKQQEVRHGLINIGQRDTTVKRASQPVMRNSKTRDARRQKPLTFPGQTARRDKDDLVRA